MIEVEIVGDAYVLTLGRLDFLLLTDALNEHLNDLRDRFDVMGLTYQQAIAWGHELSGRTHAARVARTAELGLPDPVDIPGPKGDFYREIHAAVEREYPPNGVHIWEFRERAGPELVNVEIRGDDWILTLSRFEYLLLTTTLQEYLQTRRGWFDGGLDYEHGTAWAEELAAKTKAAEEATPRRRSNRRQQAGKPRGRRRRP